MHVDSLDPDVSPPSEDLLREETISRPDVEDTRSGRDQLRQVLSQHADAASEDVVLVNLVDCVHRRFIPSTLMKKLERTVWKPRVVSVKPGITQRIVWA